MKRVIAAAVLMAMLLFGMASSALARQQYGTGGWRFEFTPYFWFTSISGDSTVNGLTSEVDLSFGDILENFDVIGLAGRFEAWHGNLGFYADGMYMNAETQKNQQTITPIVIDTNVELTVTAVEGGVFYEAARHKLEGEGTFFALQPYAGLRYMYLKQEIKLEASGGPFGGRGTVLGGSDDWWDPFMGLRLIWQFHKSWYLGMRGDVGGFGVGSDINLKGLIGIGWQFTSWGALRLGYQAQYFEYSDDGGSDEFGFEGTLHGPILGLTFIF